MQALHINALEFLRSKLGLIRFFKDNRDIKQIRVNNMGRIWSNWCDDIAFDMWQWEAEQQIWVSAADIPGYENVVADKNSRIFEWSSK